MASVVITNFGDSNTTGNTVLQQNLTVQGVTSTFFGNVLAGFPTVGIANVTNPLSCVYALVANTQVMNVTSVWGPTGFIGVGTTAASGTTLYVLGNVAASNALTTPNVFATLVNTQFMNVTSVWGPAGFTGVGTSGPSGTTLFVQGNTYVSNGLVTPNVYASLANVTFMNVQTLVFNQNLGIGTQPGLANLSVVGWINVTNSIVTTNVYAVQANAQSLNVQSIWGLSGSVGIGTSAPLGTTLYVQGNVWASNALTAPNILSNVSNTVLANVQTLVVQGFTGLGGALASGPTLNVLGNVQVSNALVSQNVFTNLFNVSVLTNTATLVVQGFTGLGGALASGPTLNVLGNVQVSNALTTQNLVASLANLTSANLLTVTIPGNLGVGGALASGPTLNVLGNVQVSNALTTTNLQVTGTLNIASGQANVTSFIAATAGFGGALASGPTINVLGNIQVSNALTTQNLITALANIQTLNAQTLSFSFPANIGIGTSVLPGGANLYVIGNVVVSNALTAQNVLTGTLYYGEDLFRRGPYLLPSGSNAATIQNWISATCNAASQPTRSWWATSPAPSFGNVASGPRGNSDYWGGVLLPDGRVLFVPQVASNVGYFNPATGLFSSGPFGATPGFRGGVLVPSGNVVLVPYTSANAVVLNPLSGAFTNVPCGGSFQGGCLIPSGNVAFFPKGSSNIGVLNPVRLTFSNAGPCGSFGGGGTLLPNGNVAVCPSATGNIGLWNSSTVGYPLAAGAFTNVGPVQAQCETAVLGPNGNVAFFPWSGQNVVVWGGATGYPLTTGAYTNVACGAVLEGATLLPSGNVICAGLTLGSNVGTFDPVQLVFSNLTGTGSGYAGATLLPDGRVVFTPTTSANVGVLDTQVPVDPAFCLNPLFNKF
jgi:hypothetical protein